ncbi:unnamed protein product [Amoebophrya sp. A120]|nr:unnamed protein product [Amoebophrya sp. A120]|eukprot:GSA120T00023956001.1
MVVPKVNTVFQRLLLVGLSGLEDDHYTRIFTATCGWLTYNSSSAVFLSFCAGGQQQRDAPASSVENNGKSSSLTGLRLVEAARTSTRIRSRRTTTTPSHRHEHNINTAVDNRSLLRGRRSTTQTSRTEHERLAHSTHDRGPREVEDVDEQEQQEQAAGAAVQFQSSTSTRTSTTSTSTSSLLEVVESKSSLIYCPSLHSYIRETKNCPGEDGDVVVAPNPPVADGSSTIASSSGVLDSTFTDEELELLEPVLVAKLLSHCVASEQLLATTTTTTTSHGVVLLGGNPVEEAQHQAALLLNQTSFPALTRISLTAEGSESETHKDEVHDLVEEFLLRQSGEEQGQAQNESDHDDSSLTWLQRQVAAFKLLEDAITTQAEKVQTWDDIRKKLALVNKLEKGDHIKHSISGVAPPFARMDPGLKKWLLEVRPEVQEKAHSRYVEAEAEQGKIMLNFDFEEGVLSDAGQESPYFSLKYDGASKSKLEQCVYGMTGEELAQQNAPQTDSYGRLTPLERRERESTFEHVAFAELSHRELRNKTVFDLKQLLVTYLQQLTLAEKSLEIPSGIPASFGICHIANATSNVETAFFQSLLTDRVELWKHLHHPLEIVEPFAEKSAYGISFAAEEIALRDNKTDAPEYENKSFLQQKFVELGLNLASYESAFSSSSSSLDVVPGADQLHVQTTSINLSWFLDARKKSERQFHSLELAIRDLQLPNAAALRKVLWPVFASADLRAETDFASWGLTDVLFEGREVVLATGPGDSDDDEDTGSNSVLLQHDQQLLHSLDQAVVQIIYVANQYNIPLFTDEITTENDRYPDLLAALTTTTTTTTYTTTTTSTTTTVAPTILSCRNWPGMEQKCHENLCGSVMEHYDVSNFGAVAPGVNYTTEFFTKKNATIPLDVARNESNLADQLKICCFAPEVVVGDSGSAGEQGTTSSPTQSSSAHSSSSGRSSSSFLARTSNNRESMNTNIFATSSKQETHRHLSSRQESEYRLHYTTEVVQGESVTTSSDDPDDASLHRTRQDPDLITTAGSLPVPPVEHQALAVPPQITSTSTQELTPTSTTSPPLGYCVPTSTTTTTTTTTVSVVTVTTTTPTSIPTTPTTLVKLADNFWVDLDKLTQSLTPAELAKLTQFAVELSKQDFSMSSIDEGAILSAASIEHLKRVLYDVVVKTFGGTSSPVQELSEIFAKIEPVETVEKILNDALHLDEIATGDPVLRELLKDVTSVVDNDGDGGSTTPAPGNDDDDDDETTSGNSNIKSRTTDFVEIFEYLFKGLQSSTTSSSSTSTSAPEDEGGTNAKATEVLTDDNPQEADPLAHLPEMLPGVCEVVKNQTTGTIKHECSNTDCSAAKFQKPCAQLGPCCTFVTQIEAQGYCANAVGAAEYEGEEDLAEDDGLEAAAGASLSTAVSFLEKVLFSKSSFSASRRSGKKRRTATTTYLHQTRTSTTMNKVTTLPSIDDLPRCGPINTYCSSHDYPIQATKNAMEASVTVLLPEEHQTSVSPDKIGIRWDSYASLLYFLGTKNSTFFADSSTTYGATSNFLAGLTTSSQDSSTTLAKNADEAVITTGFKNHGVGKVPCNEAKRVKIARQISDGAASAEVENSTSTDTSLIFEDLYPLDIDFQCCQWVAPGEAPPVVNEDEAGAGFFQKYWPDIVFAATVLLAVIFCIGCCLSKKGDEAAAANVDPAAPARKSSKSATSQKMSKKDGAVLAPAGAAAGASANSRDQRAHTAQLAAAGPSPDDEEQSKASGLLSRGAKDHSVRSLPSNHDALLSRNPLAARTAGLQGSPAEGVAGGVSESLLLNATIIPDEDEENSDTTGDEGTPGAKGSPISSAVMSSSKYDPTATTGPGAAMEDSIMGHVPRSSGS